jgi:predicted lipid-binding transport protein (Tim44 family)
MDTNVLTLLVIMGIACWKILDRLGELRSAAAKQREKLALKSAETIGKALGGYRLPEKIAASVSTDVVRGLKDIGRADPSFAADDFLAGGCAVYEAVVVAFAEGERAILRTYLSPEVHETFLRSIADREARREHVELDIIRLGQARIAGAGVFGGSMQIAVNFETDLVTATRNEAGEVVAGDPASVITTGDRWTFARETGSPDPVWKVVATGSLSGDCERPESETGKTQDRS